MSELRTASEGFNSMRYYVKIDGKHQPTERACPKCGREMGWGHARGVGVVLICSGASTFDAEQDHGYVLVDHTGKTL